LELFKQVERFIFLIFRVAEHKSHFKKSYLQHKFKQIFNGETNLKELTIIIKRICDEQKNSIIKKFSLNMKDRFKNGGGFYSWYYPLRYFFYEYEVKLQNKNQVKKIFDETIFSSVKKDKISIEHILPQSLNEYWGRQFGSYNQNQIRHLSGSLGNLLLLSQSINSSLSNDSFPDKKTSKKDGRRGYDEGSHSEVEVSKNTDWNAQCIRKRGLNLLEFFSERWDIELDQQQMIEILNIEFVTAVEN